jgi:hypothetical protein
MQQKGVTGGAAADQTEPKEVPAPRPTESPSLVLDN